jgi:hypothetical protein
MTEFFASQRLEHFNDEPSILRPPAYKQAIVLVHNVLLEANFKRELVYQCTRNLYALPHFKQLKARQEKNLITRQLSDFYDFSTPTIFAGQLEGLGSAEMIALYDSTIFIIDEAHHLYNQEGENDFEEEEESEEPSPGDKSEKRTRQERTRKKLRELFDLLPRRKVVALTATPMRNKVREMGFLMNMILPQGEKIEPDLFENAVDGDKDAEMAVRKAMRGRCKFVMELDNGVDTKFLGVPIGELAGPLVEEFPQSVNYTTQIVPLMMSPFQSKVYTNLVETHRRGVAYQEQRQAALAAFPDETSGTEGFNERTNRWIRKAGNWWELTPEFKYHLSLARVENPQNPVSVFSAKFGFIGELALRKAALGQKGFIPQDYKVGSGVILLGLLLEEFGFERFKESDSVFTYEGGVRKVRIQPKLRYGILMPGFPAAQLDAMRDLYNSPENIHGGYILLLITSPVGKEGLSFDSTLWAAINTSWNQAADEQLVGRILRATSQARLLTEKRRDTNNPNARIEVEIYRLAAMPLPSVYSVDVRFGIVAERKGRRIKTVERWMKEEAVDYFLEVERNQPRRLRGKDYTPECDFQECTYPPSSNPPREPLDEGGMLQYYSSEYRGEIVSVAIEMLKKRSSWTLEEVLDAIPSIPARVVLLELSKWSTELPEVINRYGVPGFVVIQSGWMVWSPTAEITSIADGHPVGGNVSPVVALSLPLWRLNRLVGTENLTLGELRKGMLQNLPPLPVEELAQQLDGLNLDITVGILEQSVIEWQMKRDIGESPSEGANEVLIRYNPRLYLMDVATDEIRAMILSEQGRANSRPLPPAPPVIREGESPPQIFVHTMLGRAGSRNVKYSEVVESENPKMLRILELSNRPLRWRDANWIEVAVYGSKVQEAITAREAPMMETGCYGIALIENRDTDEYWIRRNNPNSRGDGRSKYRGLKCESFDPKKTFPAVLYSLGLIGVQPDYVTPLDVIERELNGVQFIYGTEDEKRSIYAYRQTRPLGKAELCRIIKDRLIESGRFTYR